MPVTSFFQQSNHPLYGSGARQTNLPLLNHRRGNPPHCSHLSEGIQIYSFPASSPAQTILLRLTFTIAIPPLVFMVWPYNMCILPQSLFGLSDSALSPSSSSKIDTIIRHLIIIWSSVHQPDCMTCHTTSAQFHGI